MFQSVVAFFAFTPPRTFPGGPRADSRLELLHTCIYATAHQHCSQSNTILPSTTSLLPTIQPPSPQPTPATQYSCPSSVLSLVRHKGESKHCYPTDCHSTPQLQISNGTRRLYRCVTEKFSLPETHPEESFQHKKRGQLRHCSDPRQYRRRPLYSGFSTHLPFDRSTGSLVIVTPSPHNSPPPPPPPTRSHIGCLGLCFIASAFCTTRLFCCGHFGFLDFPKQGDSKDCLLELPAGWERFASLLHFLL